MKNKLLSSNVNDVWRELDEIVSNDKSLEYQFSPNWNQVPKKLGITDKKQKKAFHARRHRKSSDWEFIVSIFEALDCKLYLVVPDKNEDKMLLTMFSHLEIDDRNLVLKLINRLIK